MKKCWFWEVLIVFVFCLYYSVSGGWDGENHIPFVSASGDVDYGLPDLDAFALQEHNTIGVRSVVVQNNGLVPVALLYPPQSPTVKNLVDFNNTFYLRSGSHDLFPWVENIATSYWVPAEDDIGRYDKTFVTLQPRLASQIYQDELFRFFDFKGENLKDHKGKHLDGTEKKLVILVHGWNPFGNPSGYKDKVIYKDGKLKVTGMGGLLSSIANDNNVKKSDWTVVRYDWAPDAATGWLFDGSTTDGDSGAQNGAQAAEIAHQHGQHLGRLLAGDNRFPNLEKVQFIAHSAGTWAARAATKYMLNQRDDVEVQITLLDPFIANLADSQSPLGKGSIDEIAGWDGIDRLENIYTYDASDLYNDCTSQVFDWGSENINYMEIALPDLLKDPWLINFAELTVGQFLGGHSWPINVYEESVANAHLKPLSEAGWRNSMFYRDVMRLEESEIPDAFGDIWDISGNYSENLAGMSVTYTLAQDAKGKLTGWGNFNGSSSGVSLQADITSKGTLKADKSGNVVIKLNMKYKGVATYGKTDKFSGSQGIIVTINPDDLVMYGTVKTKISMAGQSFSQTDSYSLDLPFGMDGSNYLTASFDEDPKGKVLGFASCDLSNGETISFEIKGKRNTKVGTVKLSLKGRKETFDKGSKLKVEMTDDYQSFLNIKGKTIGQSISIDRKDNRSYEYQVWGGAIDLSASPSACYSIDKQATYELLGKSTKTDSFYGGHNFFVIAVKDYKVAAVRLDAVRHASGNYLSNCYSGNTDPDVNILDMFGPPDGKCVTMGAKGSKGTFGSFIFLSPQGGGITVILDEK
jgi:hypothetical protein